MNYPVNYYVVQSSDLMRPDMISYKLYQTVNYWWLLLYINNIYDPFNDLYAGLQMKVPSLLDIYSFYKRYSVR